MSGLDSVLDAPIRETHVIPVDASLTPDQAWAEMCRYGKRATFTDGPITWAVVSCDGVECASINQGEPW